MDYSSITAQYGGGTITPPTTPVNNGLPIDTSTPDYSSLVKQYGGGTITPPVSPVVTENKPSTFSVPNPLVDQAKGIYETAKSGVNQFGEGFNQISEGINKGDFQGVGRGILNEATGGIQTVLSPLTATFNQLTGNKFNEAMSKIQTDLEDPNNQGLASQLVQKVSDSPSFQKFAIENPHSAEVFNNIVTIASTVAGGEKTPEIGTALQDATKTLREIPTVVKSDLKTAIEPRYINQTIDEWNRVGGDYVKTDKLLTQEEARLKSPNNPASVQDTPTFLSQQGISPESLIGNNGKFSTLDVAEKLTTDAVKPFEEVLTQQLKVAQEGKPLVTNEELATQVKKNIDSINNVTEGDRELMQQNADRELAALQKKYPNGISLDQLNVQKGNYWRNTKFDLARPLQPQVNYNIGSAMKDIIETNAGDANISELNGVLGNYYKAGKFLRGLDNRVPKLTVGQKITRGVVKGVATTIGSKLFGIEGGIGGFLLSRSISTFLESASNPLKSFVLRNLEKTNPAAYTEAIKWLGKQEAEKLQRLALPPGSPLGSDKNPFITPPPLDKSGVQLLNAKISFPTQNPRTGKMQRTYTSEGYQPSNGGKNSINTNAPTINTNPATRIIDQNNVNNAVNKAPTTKTSNLTINDTIAPKKGIIQSLVDKYKSIPNKQGGFVKIGGDKFQIIPESTKKTMIGLADYLNLKQPYSKAMEADLHQVMEKYNINHDWSNSKIADTLEKLIEFTQTR